MNKGPVSQFMMHHYRHFNAAALVDAEQACSRAPGLASAHFNRGLALGDLGRHLDSAAAYRATLQIQPQQPVAWNNLGFELEAASRPEEALGAYAQAIARDPAYADAHINLANTLQELHRTEEAVQHVDAALKLRPDHDGAWFTRGTLLGGLDAPTGGQSQSNPHPVLIRLSDNSVLPNRFRGEYRDCFVIAAGYGDISSERAYLRTESLSCVRADGATLEVKIQGSVYGEDGKVGMRGRLVTKQGQMLANALLAGVVSGIGQGLATSSTNVSTSPLGTITSASGADAYRAGLGTGVGRALDRLAQYYIKLAENTFPVIEVDAGREIDVVITKGVRIDVPMSATAAAPLAVRPSNPEVPDDAND